MTRTAFRTCPLCEASCGLEITLRDAPDGGEEVVRIRGDRDDVFSKGYICPKGSTLKQLHDDPDRLRRPLVKRDGEFVEVSWDEAFAEIEARLLPVLETHGRDSCAAYVGNPNAHNLAGLLYLRAILRSLGSKNLFSASTVDQRPKEISAALMFGGSLNVPVPDVDRTDHLLMLGANPFASNGSLATAPDWPGRLEKLVARGGKLVVVDPRRSRTAEAATEWVPVRPGADAYLLMAMVQVIVEEGLVSLGRVRRPRDRARCRRRGLRALHARGGRGRLRHRRRRTSGDTPASSRRRRLRACTGASAPPRRSSAPSPPGSSTCSTSSPATSTGPAARCSPPRPSGAANTRGTPRFGKAIKLHRHHSRVRALPETMGELPVVALAEEIDTPGEGQIRALITVAGNPVLSTPDSARLDAALAGLECMVAIDIYLNETTRHADVILPAPSALQKSHYDLALLPARAAQRRPTTAPRSSRSTRASSSEWEVFARLAMVLQGPGSHGDPAVVDDLMADVAAAVGGRGPHRPGRTAATSTSCSSSSATAQGPERILDIMLRTGPYGDGFGADPDGLSLDVLIATRTASTSARSSRGCPTCCAPRTG